jgi:biopolymer transport protein ExbD
MRFHRNAKVFRGQLDAAPFATVFFLLLVFVVLGALVHTPGTPLRLTSATHLLDSAKHPLIEISQSGDIFYNKQVYHLDTLENLRADLAKLPRGSVVAWATGTGAPPRELLTSVREIAQKNGLSLQTGPGINLPASDHGVGVPGRVVLVAVDMSGQFYFENQVIQERELKDRLAKEARQDPDATLGIMADKDVPDGTVSRLWDLALEAGFKKGLKATRPRLLGTGGH